MIISALDYIMKKNYVELAMWCTIIIHKVIMSVHSDMGCLGVGVYVYVFQEQEKKEIPR